jgi:hypothetical protein
VQPGVGVAKDLEVLVLCLGLTMERLDLLDPLFRAAAAVHAEHLAHDQAVRERMEVKHGQRLMLAETPEFAEYATLRRGIGFETENLAWCRWMIERLEDHQNQG